jgi:hypothetical protein
VTEPQGPKGPDHQGNEGPARLLAVVDRSGPPHRPVGDGLLTRWYIAAATSLPQAEWADPATRHLADVFESGADLVAVEEAVVAFAQARAGADHPAEALAADLVALVRLAWPTAGHERSDWVDPVGLLARALGAWAAERDGRNGCLECYDPVTGLVSGHFLRARVRELHDQCRALDISAPLTFGAVVVDLELSAVTAPERIGVRVAAGRILASRFRAGETVAALGSSRLVAVMPAYGIGRAIRDVTAEFAALSRSRGLGVTVQRRRFADDPDATFQSVAGASVGS